MRRPHFQAVGQKHSCQERADSSASKSNRDCESDSPRRVSLSINNDFDRLFFSPLTSEIRRGQNMSQLRLQPDRPVYRQLPDVCRAGP